MKKGECFAPPSPPIGGVPQVRLRGVSCVCSPGAEPSQPALTEQIPGPSGTDWEIPPSDLHFAFSAEEKSGGTMFDKVLWILF